MSNVRAIRWAAIGEPDEIIEIEPIEWPMEQPAPVEPAVEPAKEPVPA